MQTNLSVSHLTALLYPQLHFIEYGGTYLLPDVPTIKGNQPPFDAREDFLEHWLYLAVQHRQPNSAYSLVPEVLSFYNYHLQKTFADIQMELEAFCKAATQKHLFDELFLLIADAPAALQKLFEADLCVTNTEVEPLSLEHYEFETYESGCSDIKIKLNHFASSFFKKAKSSYESYVNRIDELLNAIGKDASVTYTGETTRDYLRRQINLATQK